MQPESPKSRFIKSQFAKPHADLVASGQFQAAVDAALLQMQLGYSATTNQLEAASNHLRMEGAQAFVATFMKLADKATEKPKLPTDNLTAT